MTDINVGQLSEAINGKMDRDASNIASPKLPIFLVDVQYPTAENNYTWYRKYSDGWVEQGGTYTGSTDGWITTNLLITMKDTNYQVVIKRTRRTDTGDPGTGAIDRRCFMTNGYTTTSFKHWGIWATYPCDWEVKGMAAS